MLLRYNPKADGAAPTVAATAAPIGADTEMAVKLFAARWAAELAGVADGAVEFDGIGVDAGVGARLHVSASDDDRGVKGT